MTTQDEAVDYVSDRKRRNRETAALRSMLFHIINTNRSTYSNNVLHYPLCSGCITFARVEQARPQFLGLSVLIPVHILIAVVAFRCEVKSSFPTIHD